MDYALYPILIMAGALFISNLLWGWKHEDGTSNNNTSTDDPGNP